MVTLTWPRVPRPKCGFRLLFLNTEVLLLQVQVRVATSSIPGKAPPPLNKNERVSGDNLTDSF